MPTKYSVDTHQCLDFVFRGYEAQTYRHELRLGLGVRLGLGLGFRACR